MYCVLIAISYFNLFFRILYLVILYCIFTRVMSHIYYIAFYVIFLVFLWMGPRPMFLGPIFQPILQLIFRFFLQTFAQPNQGPGRPWGEANHADFPGPTWFIAHAEKPSQQRPSSPRFFSSCDNAQQTTMLLHGDA